MKILYDHDVFVRQRYGGVSRYFFEIISRISQIDNVESELFLGLNDSKYDFYALQNKSFHLKSIRVPSINKYYIFLTWLNNFYFKHYIKNNNYNIFHKSYYSPLGLDFKGNKVVTIHDMTHELYPEFFSPSDTTSQIKKQCAVDSDGIICVSETTQRDLIDIFDIPHEKTSVIYHGNSLRLKVTGERTVKEPYILFVGQRWGYKNFSMLLTAYAKVERFNKNFKIVCFGGGDFNYSEQLYIKEHNLEDKVFFMSGNDMLLANLYNYALALIYPSYYEGFGFPPLEAMYYGCPILVSNGGSIPEVVRNAGLYFDPYRIEDLIHKLDVILYDSGLREQIIKEGYQEEKKYNWETSANETFSFYKKIAGL